MDHLKRPMKMNSRRQFLKRSSAVAGGLTILPSARMIRGSEANSRLRLAIYGQMYNASSMMASPHLHGWKIPTKGRSRKA